MRCSAGTLAAGASANNPQRYAVPPYKLSTSSLGIISDCWGPPRWRESRLFGKLQLYLVHDLPFRCQTCPVGLVGTQLAAVLVSLVHI